MRRSKRKTSSPYASAKPNKIGENKATHEENEENLWDAVPVVQPETAISSVQKMRRSKRKPSSPYASAKPNKMGENKATHEENEENPRDAVPVVHLSTSETSEVVRQPITDHTSLFSSHQKEIYNNLIRVVGSEMDIKIRQNMFLIKDKIYNKVHPTITQVSSGSLAEGLDLPGSDMDVMLIVNDVQVIQNVPSRPARRTNLLMENDVKFSGFTRLKSIDDSDHESISECFVNSGNGKFLSNVLFRRKCIGATFPLENSEHGPCLSDKDGDIDIAICFRLYSWPRQAKEWIDRHRPGQWPPNILIHEIVNYGCTLVSIGPREIDNELFWRISFAMGEKQLSHAMNYTQMLCYALLKLSLKNIIDRNNQAKDLLCSYFMKTAVFWVSEENSINAFQLQNLFHCYCLCLDKIISWVECCKCPNYFIPKNNMFSGKINRNNNLQLLNVLKELRNGDHGVFTLFNCEAVLHDSCTKLEVLFYKVLSMDLEVGISKGNALLRFIKLLATSQSSSILSGICNYYYAMASQTIVQKLPFPTKVCCDKHLDEGKKSDAVSGWLLCASFNYVLGQYNAALKTIDDILSRCTTDMIMLNKSIYTTDDIEYYKRKVGCSNITLNGKMRLATMHNVCYVHQSTLIPHELKPEVQGCNFYVPPNIMSHCLRFLCYHHLHNIDNRNQSLGDLDRTIKEREFISGNELSNSLTIFGVCNEIVGDKKAADLCYDRALQCEYRICPTAAKRKENLNKDEHV